MQLGVTNFSLFFVSRFERPADKEYVTENVQPTTYSSTSLNRSLGSRGPNSPGFPNATKVGQFLPGPVSYAHNDSDMGPFLRNAFFLEISPLTPPPLVTLIMLNRTTS